MASGDIVLEMDELPVHLNATKTYDVIIKEH